MKISKLYKKAIDSYIEFHAFAEFKFRFVGIIGAIGFPAYYFIWAYLFPQPYENLTLRIIGSVLCFCISIKNYWPGYLRKYYFAFTYVSLLYSLPFFFTFMLLMNETNLIWTISMLAAFLVILLIYDYLNIFIISVVGILLGWTAFYFQTGSLHLSLDFWAAVPVFIFSFIAIFYLNYSYDVILKEKLKTATLLSGQVAHEMRTPLLGIQFEAEIAARFLPLFVETYEIASAAGLKIPYISSSQLSNISGWPTRIVNQATSANLLIDTIVMNARQGNLKTDNYEICSVRNTIQTTLERYNFKGNERSLVHFDPVTDFTFRGSELLLRHVLFNLIRNALWAIHQKGTGNITITAISSQDENQILFSDTGEGMDPDMIQYIFIPFFSGTNRENGSGIGLSFSRSIMESFGGSIKCHSELGVGTTFTLSFPTIPPSQCQLV